MTFKGWPERALDFFDGLEADNSKAYWADHREVYERDVKAPMDALLAELGPEFGETKLFRPYRDTRFSRDKSPYKTAIAARVGDGYVQLSADGLMAGAGWYHMTPEQLVRYRDAVVDDRTGRPLQDIVGCVGGHGSGGRRHGDPQDGAAGVSEGPSPHRAPPSQGPGRHEGVAGRRLARDRACEDTGR